MTTSKTNKSNWEIKIDYLWDTISFWSTIGPADSSQLMEWDHLGITKRKHAICAPIVFWNLLQNEITTNFIDLTSSIFVAVSHITYWDQGSSLKNSGNSGIFHCAEINPPFLPLLNVPAYWQSSNTKACANKMSQRLEIKVYNRGRGIRLGIYVSYCNLFCLF